MRAAGVAARPALRAHAAVHAGPLQGRPGGGGRGHQPLLVADHDLPVGADVQQQGELLLLIGAYGSARTAFVRRMTYDAPERLNACIEQQAMKLAYQSTGDVLIRIPFDLVNN